MSDAAERLAQAPTTSSTRLYRQHSSETGQHRRPHLRLKIPRCQRKIFELCPWCDKKHMRHLMPVKEARQQLGGISPTTFYALVKEGELSLVKVGRRSFVQAEELDHFVRGKRYDPSGRTEAAG
jgi:excisionase family DNA binding protein